MGLNCGLSSECALSESVGESVAESVVFLGLGGGGRGRVAWALTGQTTEHMSTEVGRGQAWGLGAAAVLGCLSRGPGGGALTRRRLVRRLMPSVSSLQKEGADTGLALVGWQGGACGHFQE